MSSLNRRNLLAAASCVMFNPPAYAASEARLPASRRSVEGGLSEARAVFTGEDSSTAWFPLVGTDQRIQVRGRISGREIFVLLDTGVERTVVDRRLADDLGLFVVNSGTAVGVTGKVRDLIDSGIDIVLPGFVMSAPRTIVIDLQPISLAANQRVDVLLGKEFFALADVDLDFQARRIRLSKPSTRPLVYRKSIVDLQLKQVLRPHIAFSMPGEDEMKAVVDLGSDAPLYISPIYYEAHERLKVLKHSLSSSMGAEGQGVDKVFTIPVLQFGGVLLHDVPARVPTSWSVSVPALMGLPLLGRFNLSVSYSRGQLGVRPIPTAMSRPFQKDRSGIGAVRSGDGLVIVFVAPGSPAEIVGLRVGDHIAEIDGGILDDAFFARHQRMGDRAAGTIRNLTLQDGRTFNLVLADYY
ncbi:MAG: aspartyl protease family protein [Caulobacteraceae bacterium]